MPRAPPRPLRLPDLVTNPQARAEYVQSHPPIYGYVSSPRDLSPYPDTPSSPSSTSASLHRISGTTLASLGSPLTPASTHTSSSVHNATWINELGKRVSASASGLMPNAEEGRGLPNLDTGSKKPRASWSSAIASTKSWFRSSISPETQDSSTTLTTETRLKEIRLSPSMVAANAAKSAAQRHLSSPYPESPLSTCTSSTFTSSRAPRVGSGLRYYTEHNPAPPQTRVQASSDPAAPPDISSPRLSLSHDHPGSVTLTLTTSAAESLPTQESSHMTSEGRLDTEVDSNSKMLPQEPCGSPPPSPPPIPPKDNKRASTPDISIILGDQL